MIFLLSKCRLNEMSQYHKFGTMATSGNANKISGLSAASDLGAVGSGAET
jgi:hypothetical protein